MKWRLQVCPAPQDIHLRGARSIYIICQGRYSMLSRVKKALNESSAVQALKKSCTAGDGSPGMELTVWARAVLDVMTDRIQLHTRYRTDSVSQ